MALNEVEKVKIRHHLGYINVRQVAIFSLGIPAAVESSFILESAMDGIIPEAESEVRRQLNILDKLENQEIEDAELLAVIQVDEIHLNEDEMPKLWAVYKKWQASLANLFGVQVNPFDERFQRAGSINASVINT